MNRLVVAAAVLPALLLFACRTTGGEEATPVETGTTMAEPTPTPALAITPVPSQPISEQWGLYFVKADGSTVTRLTDGFGHLLGWRDDRAIVGMGEQLLSIDTDTGELEVVMELSPRTTEVALSPDAEYVATVENAQAPFTSPDQKPGADTLKLFSFDGSARHIVRHGGRIASLIWSPDGQRLAYRAGKALDKYLTIFVVDVDSPAEEMGVEKATQFQWSPDGERIIYSLCNQESNHVSSTRIDGTDRLTLTFKELDQCAGQTLAVNPDGGSVIVWYELALELAVVPTDGSRRVEAVIPGMFGTWSPDGRVFFGRHGETTRLLYDVDSGEETAVAPSVRGYDWSPDARRLAYTAEPGPGESPDLYVWDQDTGTSRHLLHTPGRVLWQWSPMWAPNGEGIVVLLEAGGRS